VTSRRCDAAIAAAMPDVLEQVAGGLRAGASLLGALTEAAQSADLPEPLAEDLARVISLAEEGGLTAALDRWAAERPLPAVGAVAAALEVTATTGAPAAVALDGLAAGLRDRQDAAAEITALSAQARLSALVVGAAPVISLGLSLLADPRVVRTLFATARGAACLLLGIALEGLAFLWMRRIVRGEPKTTSGSRRCEVGGLRPEAIGVTADVLAMAVAAGLTPYLALEMAVRFGPPSVADRIEAVLIATGDGLCLADALDAEARRMEALRPLLALLAASERSGAAVAAPLIRLAAATRAQSRRRAMARARTVPVRLLFPLVFLVLPAFLLLTVAPVVLASLTH